MKILMNVVDISQYSDLKDLMRRSDVSTVKESFRKLFRVVHECNCASHAESDVDNQIPCHLSKFTVCEFCYHDNVGDSKYDICDRHCNNCVLPMLQSWCFSIVIWPWIKNDAVDQWNYLEKIGYVEEYQLILREISDQVDIHEVGNDWVQRCTCCANANFLESFYIMHIYNFN